MQLPVHRSTPMLLLALLFATLVGCATQPDPYREQIDALAAPYIDGGFIIGMSVGILIDGEQYTYHYGSTHVDGDQQPDDRTLYEIGSISKTFTGLMLARGVIDNHWQLDDPITDYLPDDIDLPDGITLVRLSTHTSGLPRMPHDFAPTDVTNPYLDYDREKLYNSLRTITLDAEPGSAASYSNLGVGLLGDTLAQQRGMSYEALLSDWILKPLRMRHTTIDLDDRERTHFAGAHNMGGEPDYPWDFQALAGAGAIRSDVSDMLRYAQAQMEPEKTPIAEAIRLTQQRHTDPDGPSLGDGTGLGWIFFEAPHETTAAATVFGHNGQTGGYHCTLGIDSPSAMAIVILTNTSNDFGSRFSSDLRKLLQGETFEPIELPTRQPTIDVAPQILERYVGQYQMMPGIIFTITRDKYILYAQLTDQPALRIYPTSETEFEYHAVEARIVFEVDAQGRATKLTLHQNGQVMESPRIEHQVDE